MYSKILLPFTQEPPSPWVLAVAGAVAAKHGSELWLLHIQQTKTRAGVPQLSGARLRPEQDSGESFGKSGLLDALNELRKKAIGRIRLFSATGNPRDAILKTAEKHGPDVIILESPRRTTWEALRGESIVTELIDRTPCDLIVVRRDQQTVRGIPEGMQFSISLN